MGFSVVAWTQSVDQATVAAISAAADQSVTTSSNDIITPPWAKSIIWVYANGTSLTEARLRHPSLKKNYALIDYTIPLFDRSVTPSNPPRLQKFLTTPVVVESPERLNAFTSEDGAGATRQNLFAALYNGKSKRPSAGMRRVLKFTGTTTLTTFTWTNGSLTALEALDPGWYEIIGMKAASAGLIAARLVFNVAGISHLRPGCIGIPDANGSGLEDPIFRNGNLGAWGYFRSESLPTVDYFSTSADTAEVVWLDVVKVAVAP